MNTPRWPSGKPDLVRHGHDAAEQFDWMGASAQRAGTAATQAAACPRDLHTVKGAGHGFHDATADPLMFEHFAKYLKPATGGK